MRDILVTLIIAGLIPWILWRPWIGVLASAWLSIFSPHRFAFGFANDAPFAALIGGVTLVSLLCRPTHVRIPVTSATILLVLLAIWMSITTLTALEPYQAQIRWAMVMKVFFFVALAAALLRTRKQFEAMIWVIVISVGFYGVKGGLFTIMTGGASRVWGPPGASFISDNNAIAVGLIMIIPLMRYLFGTTKSSMVRWALMGSMLLCGVAVLGTQSRGALLGVLAMLVFLWIKGSRKLASGAILLMLVPLAIAMMPDRWTDRMRTIETYDQDSSAMGRINAWTAAVNVANDRPIVGGGFEYYSLRTFERYAPNPQDVHSAHSIYFQMLGEHGYVGLLLFVCLALATWQTARRLIRKASAVSDDQWAAHLAKAIQVSLIGFAVSGLFVNISYWELPYYLIVILVATERLVSERTRTAPAPLGDSTQGATRRLA